MTDSHDDVNFPKHYQLPNGLECIEVTENFDFLIGNVIKYIWRAGHKDGSSYLKDLRKAQWYLNRAITRAEANEDKE